MAQLAAIVIITPHSRLDHEASGAIDGHKRTGKFNSGEEQSCRRSPSETKAATPVKRGG
jgi:hypothetical protein